MEHMEMAEKLSQKAGVTLEEARDALVENDWDMLDAMIALERRNPKKAGDTVVVGGDAQRAGEQAAGEPRRVKNTAQKDSPIKNGFAQLWDYIKKIFRLMVETDFIISRKERELTRFPVIVLAVLLLFCFWAVPVVLFVGLFLGCQYRFEGKGKASEAANKAMEKLENAVDSVKDAIDSEN